MVKKEIMHTTEVISTKQMTDESIAIKIRCCDNPKTDSVWTIYGVEKLSPKELAKIVEHHHDRVAEKCRTMGASMKLLGMNEFLKSKNHGAK